MKLQNRLESLLPLLFFLLPVLPLFLLNSYYCTDWLNPHLWQVGYTANFLKGHFAFPATLSTENFAAIPYSAFYARWLSFAAGLIAAISTPEIGLRLAVIAVHAAHFAAVYAAFRLLKGPRFALIAAALVTWTVYPWTNLYNRAAVPEFVSTVSLETALCLIVLFLRSEKRSAKAFFLTSLTLCLGWLFGNHPITTVYGAFFLTLTGIFLFAAFASPKARFKNAILLCLAAMMALIANSPTLYMLLKYADGLRISQTPHIAFTAADTLLSRLFPIPFDKRSLLLGTKIDTPYLETQINLPLLGLCLSFFFSKSVLRFQMHRRLALACLAAAAISLLFSVWPAAWNVLPSQLQIVQCPYRLVSYVNLLLLTATLLLAATDALPKQVPVWLTYGLLCLIIKLTHVGAVKANKHILHADEDPTYLSFSYSQEPLKNYTSVRMLAPLPPALARGARKAILPIEISKSQFGEIKPARAPAKGWTLTNIVTFPWNEIYLDGQRVPNSKLANMDQKIAVFAPNAGAEISVKTRPDAVWLFLNAAANALMLLLAALVVFFSLSPRKSKR